MLKWKESNNSSFIPVTFSNKWKIGGLAFLLCLVIVTLFTLHFSGNLGGGPSRQLAMFSAIGRNDTNRVVDLLKQGVDPNIRSGYINNETALDMATRFGYVDIVAALLSAGANPNSDSNGFPPLYVALTSPYLNDDDESMELVALLIKHGAAPNGKGVAQAIASLSSGDRRVVVYRNAQSRLVK
jgi:hypothetical protein